MILLIAVFRGRSLSNITGLDLRDLALKPNWDIKHHSIFWGSSVLGTRDWFGVLCKLEEGGPKVWHLCPFHCHSPARREYYITETPVLSAMTRWHFLIHWSLQTVSLWISYTKVASHQYPLCLLFLKDWGERRDLWKASVDIHWTIICLENELLSCMLGAEGIRAGSY